MAYRRRGRRSYAGRRPIRRRVRMRRRLRPLRIGYRM